MYRNYPRIKCWGLRELYKPLKALGLLSPALLHLYQLRLPHPPVLLPNPALPILPACVLHGDEAEDLMNEGFALCKLWRSLLSFSTSFISSSTKPERFGSPLTQSICHKKSRGQALPGTGNTTASPSMLRPSPVTPN